MRKIPIIIDGDPGVDDSFAIALAHSCSDFELVALTAVEGNVPAEKTRLNAMGLREVLDINCVVAYGAELPLEKAYLSYAAKVHGESGVGPIQWPKFNKKPDVRPAWDLIYEEAVKRKGELVLIAIGPLTNIALTLRKHPDLPQYLKGVYIMGGGTFGNVTKQAEFNIWIDPLAAKEVFERLEVHMVGLNATHASALTEKDFNRMISLCIGENSAIQLLKKLSEFSKKNSSELGMDNHIIHDALTVASVMDSEVVRYEPYYVYVEDKEEMENVGETVIDLAGESGNQPNCLVAMEVNQPKFVEMLMEMCQYYTTSNEG